jgi:hypothetical protein
MTVFNVKEHFPEARAIYYTGPLDFTKVRCSKELINGMIVIGDKKESKLTKLLLSEQDFEDIRSYGDEEYDGPHVDYLRQKNDSPYWGISLQLDDRLSGSGVIIGITEEDWVIIVGETGRSN